MIERLLPFYERELTFLKQEAVLFARQYPQLAGRLDIHENDTENIDPHAERFIQAAALLAARVRAKIEDDFPELSDTLLDLVFPHFLEPIPSTTVVEFRVDPEQSQPGTRTRVPRGTALESQPMDGETCRFQTCFDVDVWPLTLQSAELDSPARALPRRGRSTGIVSSLRLRLVTAADASIHAMELDRLQFHLDGEAAVSHGLYELLLRHCLHVEITGKTADGQERIVPLPRTAIRPMGFDDEHGLLPFPPRSFAGFRLLRELFVLPEKFLFVELQGLEALADSGIAKEMEIVFYFERVPGFHQTVSEGNLRLSCTPVVNLFEVWAEPITIDHRRTEYLVVPDLRSQHRMEAWSVEHVAAEAAGARESVGITPLFSFGHAGGPDGTQLTWQPRRRQSAEGHSEMWLSIGLPEKPGRALVPEVLSVRLLCTNRDKAMQIEVGDERRGDFTMDPPIAYLRILARRNPTPPIRFAAGRPAVWKLVSHLALNQVSLVTDGGAELRALLELYEPTATRAARQKIQAIRDLRSERTMRVLKGSVLRGVKLEMVLDRTAFQGAGHFLFASVLDRFLAMYVALNSFSMLSVVAADQAEDRIDFPARAGHQVVL